MKNIKSPSLATAKSVVPLCIDCDGTLICTDLLHESVLHVLKRAPWFIFMLPFWLLRGKFFLKERIAERVAFDWAALPYRREIIELINAAKTAGRTVVLATASPKLWAEGVAAHCGLFDQVVASEAGINLAGKRKAIRLSELFGERGFDYAGNSADDLAVWNVAQSGIIVSSSPALIAAAKRLTVITKVVALPTAGPMVYMRAMRVHQWLKNLLVLIPLFAAHQVGAPGGIMQAALAFMAFSLCASAVYVINDLLDLDADRAHVRKRLRPFASCALPIWQGVLIAPILLGSSVLISSRLPTAFSAVLAFYFALTLVYSLRLKRQVIVDVQLLASLYTFRIIAGAAATGIVPSFWLLAFSMFIFLSLAIVKRYSELYVTLQQQKDKAAGRGYAVSDLPVLASLGASAGMAAVLVLALYINDPETARLYPAKFWLWLVPPLMLYWISRIWLKTCRGEVDDDPIVFAIKDWQSLTIGALLACCFLFAATHNIFSK